MALQIFGGQKFEKKSVKKHMVAQQFIHLSSVTNQSNVED
jgi:hypothetical protein